MFYFFPAMIVINYYDIIVYISGNWLESLIENVVLFYTRFINFSFLYSFYHVLKGLWLVLGGVLALQVTLICIYVGTEIIFGQTLSRRRMQVIKKV